MNKKQELEVTKQIVNNYFHLLRVKRNAEDQKQDRENISYVKGRIDSMEFVLRKIGIDPDGNLI